MINKKNIDEIIEAIEKDKLILKFNYKESITFVELLNRLKKTLKPDRRIIKLFYDNDLSVYIKCDKVFINVDTGEPADQNRPAEILSSLGEFASDDEDRKVFE